jgi:hypothetical protein
MTPKEKAEKLVDKHLRIIADDVIDNKLVYGTLTYKLSKECALIAVDELIKQEEKYNNGTFYPSKYWQEVKQEIEKL